MSLNTLLNLANAAVESGSEIDMTQVSKGGGGILYPEGFCLGRLVGYIEMGNHVTEYQGQPKPPAPMFRLVFALFGEGYEHDGKPGSLMTFEISQSTNEKAKAYKLFKKLNYKGTAKSFAQLLGEAFLISIKHTVPKTANDKPRAFIDLEGFLPPIDALSKAPYNVPEAPDSMYKLFLWNHPTKEMWDSLFIDGTSDEGKSKNFLQDRILSATNYNGSALEAMIFGGAVPSIPSVPAAAPASPAAASEGDPWDNAPAAAPSAPSAPAAPAMAIPAVPAMPKPPAIPAVPKV